MVNLVIKILILVGSLFVGVSSVIILKMKPDNIVEQVAEKVIEEETGLNVDLSPEDSDNKTPAGNDKPAGDATDEEKTQ